MHTYIDIYINLRAISSHERPAISYSWVWHFCGSRLHAVWLLLIAISDRLVDLIGSILDWLPLVAVGCCPWFIDWLNAALASRSCSSSAVCTTTVVVMRATFTVLLFVLLLLLHYYCMHCWTQLWLLFSCVYRSRHLESGSITKRSVFFLPLFCI